MTTTSARTLVGCAFLLACAPPVRHSHLPSPEASLSSPDLAAIDSLLDNWWPHLLARDTVALAVMLDPAFVLRRQENSSNDYDRAGFLRVYLTGMICGDSVAYQVSVQDLHLVGSQAFVSQSVRFWVYGEGSRTQNELTTFHLLTKNRGGWRFREARYVWYQLPGQAWAQPEPSLFAASPLYSNNPARRVRVWPRPCVVE